MNQMLAWICLVLIASTTAYGLQLTAAALVPSAAEAHQVISDTPTRNLLVVAVDPVTGGRAQVECNVPSYSFASDTILVDSRDFPAVARECNERATSGVHS